MTESQSGLKPAEGTEMQARLAMLTWASKYAQCKSLAQIGRWIGYGRLTLPDALAYLAGLAWRPIATYPREHERATADPYWGSNVMLFIPTGRVAPKSDYRICCGRLEADMWLAYSDDGAMFDLSGAPTHWQPLPGAPK